MKRLNPKTNQYFTRGDVRDDGKVFYNYTNKLKADGFFVERWLSAKTLDAQKELDRTDKAKKRVRKSTRLPAKLREKLNGDINAVATFKRAWYVKHNIPGSTEKDIITIMKGYEQYIKLIIPSYGK